MKAKVKVQRQLRETADFLSKELGEAVPGLEQEKGQPYDPSALLFINQEINKFKRELLISFHKEGGYDQSIIRQLELELDHDESQLVRKHPEHPSDAA